jgi:hypothetical protein
MNKLIALLACIILSAHLIGCTSKDSKEEESESPLAETSQSVDGELEKVEGADSKQAAAGATDEGFLNESLPEEALGEKAATTTTTTTPEATAEAAPPAPEISPDLSLEEPTAPVASEMTPPPEDMSGVSPAGEVPPAVEAGSTPDAGAIASTTTEEAPKQRATYRKAESIPFKRGETLLNAVYVARPGDTYKSLAKMIYGDETRSKEIKSANPTLGSLQAGNKVYYNSPKRPTDDLKIMTYYEDAGLMPETYIAKEGDDLKVVSKDLLGFDGAWKEVYATNSVESKGALVAGTELKYWKSMPAAAETPALPPVAANPPPPDIPPPPPVAANPPPPDIPPPPPVAANPPPPDIPPPPPMAENPPPPPPPDIPPPPPVEPPPPAKAKSEMAGIEGMDNDTLFALAGGGIALVGIAAMVVIRRRKQQREMAAAFNDTQVGT